MKPQFKDAAIMHATRWRLSHQLQATGLPLEGGSGGCIKTQRIQHQLPKEHYYDALCVGTSTPKTFTVMPAYVAVWSAKGRGSRQRRRTDQYGFPIRYLSGIKEHCGFQTGGLVKAVVPHGQYAGTWVGRGTVKASGSFRIVTRMGIHPTIHYRYCRVLQRGNGWQITQERVSIPQKGGSGGPRPFGRGSPKGGTTHGLNAELSAPRRSNEKLGHLPLDRLFGSH